MKGEELGGSGGGEVREATWAVWEVVWEVLKHEVAGLVPEPPEDVDCVV